jgi:phosphoglycolate phosphatase-like HAD superfamily hydrolase
VDLQRYRTFVFDCDGVILNSNRVKTEAFRSVALPFGRAAAEALVEYHIVNGGISRYAKFERFLKQILPEHRDKRALMSGVPSMAELLAAFSAEVYSGLMSCEIADGFEDLRNAYPDSRWLVVSGGDQEELRKLFTERGIAHYFNGGIFGSPDTKDAILFREISSGNIRQPALFLGDSEYDHLAANQAGLDFIFVSDWTELSHWKTFCAKNSLKAISSLVELSAHGSMRKD